MPFLDLCQLFFDQAATIEDEGSDFSETSIFCEEWCMTLEYVVSQPGLKASYTSRLGAEHDLWVFLVWDTEDNRAHFYHQTLGFGPLIQRLARAPRVYLFDDAEYAKFAETSSWTINALHAERKANADTMSLKDLEEQQSADILGSCEFIVRQEAGAVDRLYQGNDFGNAIVGLTAGDVRLEQNSTGGLQWEQTSVELQIHQPAVHQTCTQTEVALDIADLTGKQPWEYGVLGYDDSEYTDTAYPMNLSFQPMMTLASGFVSASGSQRSVSPRVDNEYAMCIVSVSKCSKHSCDNETAIISLRNEFGLEDGARGLRELSILQTADDQTKTQTVRLLTVWNTMSDLAQWQEHYASHDDYSLDYTWTTDKLGLPSLEWENIPLTPDNQSWQEVDKFLEVVEFVFVRNLSPAEKEAFQQRVCAFTNTMSSCWSGEIDARPVVYAEDPVWSEAQGATSTCLLFLAWDGAAQRTAWLKNFMANGFILTGHLAQNLGRICSVVKSSTYSLEKVYECDAAHEAPVGMGDGGDMDDESDRDMGF